ncbi:hypothetical protein [Streptomyces cavernae]|uniref:hypothetical protein n=1 Tax=Streptomyces cavernae TaxID=2259034 RepID=UPI0012D9EFED|nr:hypothetical protein [Streptomyces cavernae]
MATSKRTGLQAVVTASAVGAVMALSAGQAHAATGVSAYSTHINVFAAAGKANEIFINPSGGNVIITDYGDTVTAGPGCTQLTSRSVSCPAGNRIIELLAGDRGDTVVLRANLLARLHGQAGNDIFTVIDDVTQRVVMYGDDGDDTLRGGSGNDDLLGGGGNDTMRGNAGNDRFASFDGLVGNDSSYGGVGTDNCTGEVGDVRVDCEISETWRP